MTTRSAEVVVLGGGPTGLTAAWFAARAGHDVVLVERSAGVGGLAASFEVAGVRVDHGSHRLHPSIDASLLGELWAHLGGELQRRPRNGRISLGGRWIGFPLRPLDVVRHAPPGLALGAARDLVSAPLRRQRPGVDTFAERSRAGLGPTITERFYAPYARKLWGVDASELSGELYRRRVSAGSGTGLVRRVLARPGAGRRTFWYPAGGFGRIPEALAGATAEAGAEVRTGVEVVALEPRADGSVSVALADGSRLDAGVVLSTLPATVVVGLVHTATGAVPAAVRAAASGLTSRGAVLVYLVVPRRPYTPFDAHYLPDPAVLPARVSEPAAYRDSPADPSDHTVLCAEIPATVGDATWRADDADLAGQVAEALARLGLPDPTPVAHEVRRVPFVYPVYRVGHDAAQATIEAWAASWPGLVLVGRQGLFAHDNTHHAMAMGRAAAGCLLPGGRFDRCRWVSEREAFRTHVVED